MSDLGAHMLSAGTRERGDPVVDTSAAAGARLATVTATLTVHPDSAGRDGTFGVPAAVSDLEVRADLVGDLDAGPLRTLVPGRLIYSLRSRARGGQGPDHALDRIPRLLAAARHYDLVDLEADHDLCPEVLSAIPAGQRRISWHGPAAGLATLRARFDRMAQVAARLYLVAPATTACEQALVPLQLLGQLGRDDVIAFGTGPAGTWSRLLSPWLGAPIVFGRLIDSPPLGVPTVDQLLADYPFPSLPPVERLYGIVGARAGHSLSPRLHNSAFRHLGLPGLFLPFQTHDVRTFWADVVATGLDALGLPVHGLTVAAPNKEIVLEFAATSSAAARASRAANIVVRAGTGWLADTTDGTVVVSALERLGVSCAGAAVAVIGCGGAGRATAVELVRAGADVTLVNRGVERASFATRTLGLPVTALESFNPSKYSVVVNATPVHEAPPFPVEDLAEGSVVLDFVYGNGQTALVAASRRRGLPTVDGWEVLLAEVSRQFHLMTGLVMPEPQTIGPYIPLRTPDDPAPRD